jgi:hypothetical protein
LVIIYVVPTAGPTVHKDCRSGAVDPVVFST